MDMTLTLRGDRIPLHDVVSSTYNMDHHELLVATPDALYLYGKMLTTGGDLFATLKAEENTQYLFALHISWLDAYFVAVITVYEKIEHRFLSSDLKTPLASHTLIDNGGRFLTALANPQRRELFTADTDGGIKVWVLRPIATARNRRNLTVVLRLHTAVNTKLNYLHLRMNFDGQRIFATTKTKVHVFDAASCHRLPCCISETQSTICGMESGNHDDSVYLVFKENLRKIYKYASIVNRGVLQFRKVGEYEHKHEITLFITNSRYFISPNHTCNNILLIDVSATFCIANLVDVQSDRSVNEENAQFGNKQSAVRLPLDSLSERYKALHTIEASDGRNFVLAICSSGFCLMELLFSNSQGRLPCDDFIGEGLRKYKQGTSDVTSMSVYQQTPTTQVMVFQEGSSSFCFASIPSLETDINLSIADYVITADSVVALYSHGLVKKFGLFDNRIFTIAPPFKSSKSIATTIVSLLVNDCDCVGIGDSSGVVQIFFLSNGDHDIDRLITRKQVHANDSVTVLVNLEPQKPGDDQISLLSVSRGGNVKRWQIKRLQVSSANDAERQFEWLLLVCFQTYSFNLSTARVKLPEYLFCGFDSGTIECWQLPSEGKINAHLFQQQTPNRISIVKRALHAIDLHSTPVLEIVCESRIKTTIIPEISVPNSFSWVFSFDKDATIFVWCFSLEYFFPHRRIKVNESIKGIYTSQANGGLDLFVYVDRRIDRVDHLSLHDEEAVKQRLERARQVLNQHELEKDGSVGKRFEENLRLAPSSPDANEENKLMTGATLVRFDMPLPAIITPLCKPCRETPFTRTFAKKLKQAPTIMNDAQQEDDAARIKSDTLQSVQCLSTALKLNYEAQSPSHLRCDSSQDASQLPQRSKEKFEPKHARCANSSHLPVVNSVPSCFQQAKPRVYRTVVNPLHFLPSQARCAVISSDPVNESELTMQDMKDDSENNVQSSSMKAEDLEVQEKVSLVSLVEDEEESMLLLDFKPGLRRRRELLCKERTDDRNTKVLLSGVPLLSWDCLSEYDRRVELMAASKSKRVQEVAKRNDISVPSVNDFNCSEKSMQVSVRPFTKWFTATHCHHQRVRELFLIEELTFAATDPLIHLSLADAGLTPPASQQIGQFTSTWIDFASWYSSGLTTRSQNPSVELQRERLKARTEYLKLRLRTVYQIERDIQEEEAREGLCEGNDGRSQQVYIFEHFVKRLLGDNDSPTAWENTSPEVQLKEVALALMDPVVQIAAMRNNIELPNLSCFNDLDNFTLAEKFVPWWTSIRNIHRCDFLKREALEASTSKTVRKTLLQDLLIENVESATISDTILSQLYFKSSTARHTFLGEKLVYFKRLHRIARVAQYGNLPAPLIIETLPFPLVITFPFVEHIVADEVEAETSTTEHEESFQAIEDAPVKLETHIIDYEREETSRRLKIETATTTLELTATAHESCEYVNSFAQSEREFDIQLLPKQADFSRSNVFGDLPIPNRDGASSGWQASSDTNNGDEEYEEKELLQHDDERQDLLDEQQAERLLRLERKRARLENEREEECAQLRRIKEAELKKVLLHQAQLKAKRKMEFQNAREDAEQSQMEGEDKILCWHRDQLLRNQNGMQLEDQRSYQQRSEDQKTTLRMRLLQHEQACMVAEDQRSLHVGQELQELEHKRAERKAFLSELYSPFCPFYKSSAVPSEAFLPRVQQQLGVEHQRWTRLKPGKGYAIPFEEALVFDELSQEPYLARDSRKFKILMGLPLRATNSYKRSQIPTANAIVAMQQQQRNSAKSNDERQEMTAHIKNDVLLPHNDRPRIHKNSYSRRSRLPSITSTNGLVTSLTNLKQACRTQEVTDTTKQIPSETNQQQQQNQQTPSMPLYRGIVLARGRGQARPMDYAYYIAPPNK